MTTQADIKLVIDQVITALRNADAVIPNSTVNALETLGNQVTMAKLDSDLLDEIGKELEPVEYKGSYVEGVRVIKQKIVEQAVEITKLREYFQVIKEYNLHYGLPLAVINLYKEALSTQTDSTQIFQDWLHGSTE